MAERVDVKLRASSSGTVRRRLRTSAVLALAGVLLGGCGAAESPGPTNTAPGYRVEDPGPVHVHGLGVNPADGALFIATHTGLYRSAAGQTRAKRVGRRLQDTMGFTVIGPDRFLGSGHPDGRDRLPPFLGLIRSTDAGRRWRAVSLLGKRDFHALEAAGGRVYGYGSDFQTREQGLLVSADGGRTWSARRAPEPLLTLSAHGARPERVLAGGTRAIWRSDDGARAWRRLEGPGGLVAAGPDGRAYRVSLDGSVAVSHDAGSTWRAGGRVGGEPAAFELSGGNLYVALHDGTIKQSADEGRTWRVRSAP
ncbi:MAG: glycoside hydrolase [Actinomycetota bacterium]|nr:glycoside hydrolase [Actinomycetota bacterium]